jgi:DNA modification methylase
VAVIEAIIQADARQLPIADESVQCTVTSPPYFGLRDYGNSNQIGLEQTPNEYVESLLVVASELWRVLKPDGTFWLNLGDSYARNGGTQGGGNRELMHLEGVQQRMQRIPEGSGLKEKDLIGVPWRVAFALQAAGWYLRSDIIWAKPNPMPESVTDRPTRSHEYIFLLTKSKRYYYDHEAIKEPANIDNFRDSSCSRRGNKTPDTGFKNGRHYETRNKRSVWNVTPKAYSGAHYATFPSELIKPCILAGSRPGDLILDPFAGSGTTAMVAKQNARQFIAVDLGYQDHQVKRVGSVESLSFCL